jgi:hypothetical protein
MTSSRVQGVLEQVYARRYAGIVFVHQGNSWYLPYTLRQAVSVSPSPQAVALLGDTAPGGGVATMPLEQLGSPRGDQFLKRYEHMSNHPERFERFCWLRWFYVLRYMELAGVSYGRTTVTALLWLKTMARC